MNLYRVTLKIEKIRAHIVEDVVAYSCPEAIKEALSNRPAGKMTEIRAVRTSTNIRLPNSAT